MADLTDLLRDFDKVMIVVSSSGFYDFANAYGKGVDAFKDRIKLFWVACLWVAVPDNIIELFRMAVDAEGLFSGERTPA